MNKLARHLARLGGVIVHPRASFERIVHERDGSLMELLPWIALVAVALEPVRAGQSFLLMRTSIADGIVMLASLISTRMMPALTGVLIASVVLYGVETFWRKTDERHGFDVALDLASFTLVPYLVIASAGQALAVAGADIWWLPHHPVRGGFLDRTLEIAAGYGWSIILFGWATVIFFRSPARTS